MSHTGGCVCGAVTYAIDGDLPDGVSCHCSICRKVFSGAGSAVTWLPAGRFSWTGGQEAVSRFEANSGYFVHFCSKCGSTLGAGYQDAVCITLGTLDGNPPVRIALHQHVASKADWDEIGGDAPQYPDQVTE